MDSSTHGHVDILLEFPSLNDVIDNPVISLVDSGQCIVQQIVGIKALPLAETLSYLQKRWVQLLNFLIYQSVH